MSLRLSEESAEDKALLMLPLGLLDYTLIPEDNAILKSFAG
jgi:hypothetical protein